VLSILALGPIAGAGTVPMIRFAPILHSIGGNTAPPALVMPPIAAVRGRIVSIMGRSPHLMWACDPITARTGRFVARIGPVKWRFGLDMGRIGSLMSATLSGVREMVSVIPRTMLVM
jgi:hypothetical protein